MSIPARAQLAFLPLSVRRSAAGSFSGFTQLGFLPGLVPRLFSQNHEYRPIQHIEIKLADVHLQFFDTDHGTCKSILLQQARRSLGLALHRGWAKFMRDRCRNLVQHPNRPRPTAAEATEKDDEEARAFYHHPHPPGFGVGP